MKKICITIFFLLNVAACFSQVPTQAEINKMIEQAKKIGSDTNANKSSENASVAKPTKFPSSVVNIPLKQTVQIPTPTQAKDKLLWYKGKKLNDSMLVTTKGMVVLYSKKRSLVITQPLSKSDPFKKIISNLSKARQLTSDYLAKTAATKNSFMNYPLIQLTVEEFTDIDERFNELVKNTIELLPENFASQTKTSTDKHRGGYISISMEGELDEMHKDLKELLGNPPSMNFKAPPKKEFSLSYACDSNAQKRYKQLRKEWEEEFFEYENKLISSVLQIERYISLTGTIPITKSEPGSPGLGEDMQAAFKQAFDRMDTKVKTLTGQHGKNIFSQDIVIYNALRKERSKELLGVETNSSETLLTVGGLIEGVEFENYINEQIKDLNYDVIFNVAIILGRGRQSIFLGSESTS